ncbi:MAG TPA: transcription termination factor NusA, partial [Pyrinomonadaceae bacterium]|nr:transcription termination factor NusA [Pyrinomonadaceae bacterium]
GDRIRVVIEDVSKESKGPQVVVSRTSPELLRRLFEMEVPEIYDETVVIKSAVREPGERAKIAVASNERDVDPVGACVGMKGSRVQAIIRELRGEKIDIIEWSDEPSVFAANALSPAKVNQVRITDIERRQMEVIVNEDQLSLAIGKRGQNVRLATKLVGWNIDIRSEEEIKREVAEQMGAMIASGEPVPLERLEGITPAVTAVLAERGINDIAALAETSIDDLTEYLDISLDEAERILTSAQAVVAARDAAGTTDEEGAEGAGEGTAEGVETAAANDGDAATAAEASGDETSDDETSGATIEQHAASFEADPDAPAREVEPSDAMIAEGYDEAVRGGLPFAEDTPGRAEESAADPVALTEADPMSADELVLQGAGRDLRPDTITPAPDITSSEAAVIETSGAAMDDDRADVGLASAAAFAAAAGDEFDEDASGAAVSVSGDDDDLTTGGGETEDDSPLSPVADLGGEASAPEVSAADSSYASENAEASRPGEDVADQSGEKPTDASGNEQ